MMSIVKTQTCVAYGKRSEKNIHLTLFIRQNFGGKKSWKKITGTKGWDSNDNWVAETDGDMKMFSSKLFFFRCVEKEKNRGVIS